MNNNFDENVIHLQLPPPQPVLDHRFLQVEPGHPPTNSNISFGQLGSYVYQSPILLPIAHQQLPPAKVQKSKIASYVRKLTREEAQEALIKYVDQFKCKSARVAKECHVTDVWTYNALEYTLDTFNETRHIGCNFMPPMSPIKGRNGPLPNLWTLPCMPDTDKMFINHKKVIPVPNTSVIQGCFCCASNGLLRCGTCGGTGELYCNTCGGSGRVTRHRTTSDGRTESYTVPCSTCHATGRVRCDHCNASGVVICYICNGTQYVIWYLEITCSFINHNEYYMKDKSDLPDDFLKFVHGEDLCRDQAVCLEPILDSDNQDIVENTRRLIEKSVQAYSLEYRVLQRHLLYCITCAQVKISHNGKDYKFFVYGEEKKVHFPDYPGGCCCCCCCPCCTVQ